jgi:hypothetical protein
MPGVLAERSRIGLSTDHGFRPLLGFQNSADGGILIDLARAARTARGAQRFPEPLSDISRWAGRPLDRRGPLAQ